jgi:hypothetical protein
MSRQDPTRGGRGQYPERDSIEDVDESSQDAEKPDSLKHEPRSMTSDERAQLVEDIKMSGAKRRDIAERAARDQEFDVAAAWEELEELDESINARVEKSRAIE